MTIEAPRGRPAPSLPAVLLSLAAVYVFWGSTSPAIKVGVETVPPFAFAALRFFIAGTLLWTFARVRRAPLPSRRDWAGATLTGTILLLGGNGLFAWCLVAIPGGVGSIFFALSPIWNALIGAAFYRERIRPAAIVGIALGLAGMVWLLGPAGALGLPLVPTLLAILASILWSVGSMLQRRFPATDFVQMSAMQMLAACAGLALVATLSGERLAVREFTPAALGALVWLVAFGSLVGYSAYVWLTRNVSTVLASTYAYVNPVVAMILAFAVLHEPIGIREIAGAIVVLGGVALMMLPAPVAGRRFAVSNRAGSR